AEFADILKFWLDLGVDGFRVDVAHGMAKAEGLPDVGHPNQTEMLGTAVLPYFDQDHVHDIHREWRRLLDSYGGERIAVAEAWAPTPERLAAYTRPDELHQAFNFHYLTAPWDARAMREVIDESLRTAWAVGAPATWVLSNHDVKRHVTRYGDGERGLRRARAARLGLRLPGRGARPARGARPSRGVPAGPAAAARRGRRPRRLPRPAALGGRRAPVRLRRGPGLLAPDPHRVARPHGRRAER